MDESEKHCIETVFDADDIRAQKLKTISQMASLHNLSLRALRFYESRGLLEPIRDGRARYYTPKDEIKLRLIYQGKKLGMTLAEIELLLIDKVSISDKDITGIDEILSEDEIKIRIETLKNKRQELDILIRELVVLSRSKR